MHNKKYMQYVRRWVVPLGAVCIVLLLCIYAYYTSQKNSDSAAPFRFSREQRTLALAALEKLPPGTIRRDEVANKIQQRGTLTLPDIITLGLALSRYDTPAATTLLQAVQDAYTSQTEATQQQ